MKIQIITDDYAITFELSARHTPSIDDRRRISTCINNLEDTVEQVVSKSDDK